MYRIIGADGSTYGPVPAEQVLRWIAERRANARTLAVLEGTQEWKPLSEFPDFANALGGALPPSTTPPLLSPPGTYDPRASSKIPAGICGILLGPFGVHKFILGYTGAGLIMLLVTVLTCFMAWPIVHLIGLVEGIIYLAKSDSEFVRTYVEGRREWF
jgi:TM2 domain-containing membrane protein YozV